MQKRLIKLLLIVRHKNYLRYKNKYKSMIIVNKLKNKKLLQYKKITSNRAKNNNKKKP